MSRKGKSITLSISDPDKAQLEAIALELGMMWGDRPNISKLVEAIARRQFLIAPNNNWSEKRIRALERSLHTLTDIGQIEQAQIVAELLLERSELSIPLRREIENFITNLPPAWHLQIDRYILREQPFQLSYQDAAERLWNFTVHYGKVNLHEKRIYLDCWCEETEGNQDIPELVRNWCLRLDRIQEAAVTPIPGEWRLNLDAIEVEIHLLRGLAFAYKGKQEDIDNNWLSEQPKVRRVVRKVSNTFWFFREILQYGEDCIIISPDTVRDRFKQKVKSLCQNYDIELRD